MNTFFIIIIAIFAITEFTILYINRERIKQKDKLVEDAVKNFEEFHFNHIVWQEKQEYFQSQKWLDLRTLILHRDKYTCIDCGRSDKPLEIHHITYDKWKNEDPENLVSLCRDCHQLRHDRTGYSYNKTH